MIIEPVQEPPLPVYSAAEVDEEQVSEEPEVIGANKSQKSRSFHRFKDAMKSLAQQSSDDNLEVFSSTLKKAAEELNVDLSAVFNHIADNGTPQDGRDLLKIGHGALFHNPNISRHPKMMHLWQHASDWEKNQVDSSSEIDNQDSLEEDSSEYLDMNEEANSQGDEVIHDEILEDDLDLEEELILPELPTVDTQEPSLDLEELLFESDEQELK